MPPLPPSRDRDAPSAASSRPPSFRSTITNNSMRRPPPALRTPGLGPRKAKPAVTLVFAAGDAVPPNVPLGLRRAVSGASPSEEALSRQLDQDMAGERLGLRSRRSSAATLASLRTFSADAGNTVQEEEGECDDQQAGPSRPRENTDTLQVPSCAVSTSTPSVMSDVEPTKPEPPSTPPRKVNPKHSGAWLRWNSPTPTFPKRGEKGKGREVESLAEPDHNTDTAPGQRSDAPTPTRNVGTTSAHTGDTQPGTSASARGPSPSHAHEDADINDVSGLLGRNSLNSSTTTNPVSSLTSSTASKPAESTMLAAPAEVTEKEVEAPTQSDPQSDPPPSPQPEAQSQAQPEPPKGWLEYVFGPSRPRAPAPAAKTPSTSRASAPVSTPSRTSTPTVHPAPSTQAAIATKNKAESVVSTSSTSRPPATAHSSHGPVMNGNGNEPNAKRCKLDPEIASLAPSTTPTKAPPTVSSTSAAKLMARESPAAASLKATSIRNGRPGHVPSTTTQPTPNMPSEPSSKASSAAGSAPHTPVRRSMDSTREPDSPADDPDLTPKAEPMHVAEVQGWEAYFTSFVFSSTVSTPAKPQEQPERPKNTTGHSKDSDATIVEATDPAADQKPLPTEELPGQPDERTSTPPPAHLPAPPQPVAQGSTPSPGSKNKLASSTSSTAGWLNYLAFRASQKKITGSTVGSSEPRVSGETAREEVMDFENDPNFPTAESPTKAAAEKALVKKEQKEQPAATQRARDKNLTHKRSQNLSQAQSLALEARRQSSTSSTRSGVLANERPLAAANKPKSSLPPPPQPPAKQPSLLIPSFETTFDRPPRSFLPRTTAGGVATVTGVAWRALGAMSSYVYGEKEDANKDMRGRKAGRDVGADLPRRIGLGSGTPDDGWKNVRRVVVVGVHGWFPAKMLTR